MTITELLSRVWDTLKLTGWLIFRGFDTEDELRAEINRIRAKHGLEYTR